MSALPLDAAAQLVIDQLNRHEDFNEALGQLCVLFVERHKQAAGGHGYAKYIHSEVLHDHDRVISYLWQRASQMLNRVTPNNTKHLFSLLSRLFSYCYSDIYRKEDKDKQGGSTTHRHSKARTGVRVYSGSATVEHMGLHGTVAHHSTVFDMLTCLDHDQGVEALQAKEETDQLLDMAERNSLLVRPKHRGIFRDTVYKLLNGYSMKQIGQEYGLVESRIGQLTTACLHSLVRVLQGRYPAMDAIPSDVLFNRIHVAINKLKPARTRGRTGGARVLSSRRQRKD